MSGESTHISGGVLVSREVWDDTTSTYTVYDGSGNVVSTRPYTPAELQTVADDLAAATLAASRSVNAESITTKAQQALTANAAYLAIPAPTAAEVRTQTERLTREVSGLIRLLLNQLDDISDT